MHIANVSLVPRPHPLQGKRDLVNNMDTSLVCRWDHVVWFAIAAEQTCILIGQNTSMGDSINCIARIDLHCDWSFQIPVVNSHMTLTEL